MQSYIHFRGLHLKKRGENINVISNTVQSALSCSLCFGDPHGSVAAGICIGVEE